MAGYIAGGALCLTIALVGCSREKTPDTAPVVVQASRPAPVARLVATPTPSTSMPARTPVAAPRKTFTHPPLPPELVDDARLKPLPPPPPPAAFGQGEQH